MKTTQLRGITWNHSRAFPPLVATAQRFEELNPEVQIKWEKRSLHEFGHADLLTLAQSFDLLVIDHPMLGDAEANGSLMDLKPLLRPQELVELENGFVGPSFESYLYNEKLYALPIDAAAPAASFRPDLLESAGVAVPEAWQDVLQLAEQGAALMPAFPADLFLNLMGLCVSRGSTVGADKERLFNTDVAITCLEDLRELASMMPEAIYSMNPIAVYEQMATSATMAYCPFAYTYSNYSRTDFGEKPILFANPVRLREGGAIRTVLGGTGIAISKYCDEVELAFKYSLFVSNASCQRTLYGIAGGQPARRSAWSDRTLNHLSGDFFSRTVQSIEQAYVRPRYRGYVELQEQGGIPIIEYLKHGGNAANVVDRIDSLYRANRKRSAEHV